MYFLSHGSKSFIGDVEMVAAQNCPQKRKTRVSKSEKNWKYLYLIFDS